MGGAVPGATVTITHTETNVSREATTDQVGSYRFLDIQTGTYNIKISKAGFKTYEKTGTQVLAQRRYSRGRHDGGRGSDPDGYGDSGSRRLANRHFRGAR